jgi:hypothetical protein
MLNRLKQVFYKKKKKKKKKKQQVQKQKHPSNQIKPGICQKISSKLYSKKNPLIKDTNYKEVLNMSREKEKRKSYLTAHLGVRCSGRYWQLLARAGTLFSESGCADGFMVTCYLRMLCVYALCPQRSNWNLQQFHSDPQLPASKAGRQG